MRLAGKHIIERGRVYVPLINERMKRRMRLYGHKRVHLSVDRKMKCLRHGHGITTLSILVRSTIKRNTTLKRAGAVRTQIRAHTLRAKPILHAIMDEESTDNFVQLFEDADSLWSSIAPTPNLPAIVMQLHKDYAPGIEQARRRKFSGSRHNNDFFHLSQKRSVIQSKCTATAGPDHMQTQQDASDSAIARPKSKPRPQTKAIPKAASSGPHKKKTWDLSCTSCTKAAMHRL